MSEVNFLHDVLPLKDKLFRLAWRITLNKAEAEDIVQETLIRVWQARDQWAEIENIEAYSLTITRRLAIDVTKSKHSQNLSLSDTDYTLHATAPMPDEELDLRQRIATVRNLINDLPEIQRTIIQLRDIESMRYDEISQITGLSETQVKVYLHRARTKVRDAARPWRI